MSADTGSLMHVSDIILHRWLRIPEYLQKRSKYMHMKVIVIDTNFSCNAFPHEI